MHKDARPKTRRMPLTVCKARRRHRNRALETPNEAALRATVPPRVSAPATWRRCGGILGARRPAIA
eukprot:9897742-Lingulodinium_polyedra.AAC.1